MLLPMMLRELSGALASMADGPHDERRNSLVLLNNILEVLSRDNVVRQLFSIKHNDFLKILLDDFWCLTHQKNPLELIDY